MTRRFATFILSAFALTLAWASEATSKKPSSENTGVQITRLDDTLRIELGGRLFTEYCFEAGPRPYFYPVIGPTGASVTRRWPMEQAVDEEQDHPHHRSLWFAHGAVNGYDFWSENSNAGKIVHEEFLEIAPGTQEGVIRCRNKWVAPGGRTVCTDSRTYRFYPCPEGRLMDFDITLYASHGEVVLGDTKEGSMAIRLAPPLRLKGKVGRGHIVNSEGVRDGDTWGRRAAWCDYYGPIGEATVGVAIFDHPRNPRHPTWWHVRDYGLFAANPFGVHHFEGKPEGTGDLTIPSGESLTLRYRFYFHRGNERQGKVAERYQEYIATGPSDP